MCVPLARPGSTLQRRREGNIVHNSTSQSKSAVVRAVRPVYTFDLEDDLHFHVNKDQRRPMPQAKQVDAISAIR